MPVIDERRFLLKSLIERIKRIEKVAKEVETTPTTKNTNLLKVMGERVDEMHDQFLATIEKIVAYNSKNGIEEDLSPEIVNFEDPYYQVKAVMEAAFPTTNPNQSIGSLGEGGQDFGIQLPKIKMPEFSGDVTKWQSFSQWFLASVDANTRTSAVQKHMYLQAALSGEAKSLVANLPLTGPNYKVCWDTLRKRYDSTHLQTTAHLEILFSLPGTNTNPASIRTFASKITEAVGALTGLGYDVESWAVPVLFLCSKRLHTRLREEWERHVLREPDPSIAGFTWFLHEQARVLEAANPTSDSAAAKKPSPKSNQKGALALMVNSSSKPSGPCLKCSRNHSLDQCGQFRQEPHSQRLALVRQNKLCVSCLQAGHWANECSRTTPCKHCSGKHHSLLHAKTEASRQEQTVSTPDPANTTAQSSAAVTSMQVYSSARRGQVLLATSRAEVYDGEGRLRSIRLLIDPASQATFISKACAERLRLPVQPVDVPVLGMGQVSLGVCRHVVRCNFRPVEDVELQVDAMVVDSIARSPGAWVPPLPAHRLEGLRLADQKYNEPAAVDLLLGAEWFGCVVLEKPIQGSPGTPSLLRTIWGYCVVGRHHRVTAAVQTFCTSVSGEEPDTNAILQKFFEIEESPHATMMSPADQECEAIYRATVSRLSTGRYVVALPFKPDRPELGDSRQGALSRFLMLEKRLRNLPKLRAHYIEFMKDVLDQGHMRLAGPRKAPSSGYFIPHHCIFKQDSDGKILKFRVVFDSSAATKDGPSLNNILFKGPKLQTDLLDILLRWRLREVVLVTDIRQMYRNIVMRHDHQEFQRILWRFSPEEPLKEYCLTTVCYGVAASPFLAIRTLHQLVSDEGRAFPAASDAIMKDTYMDDVIKSVSSIEGALNLKNELEGLLSRGGFELRKWMSNRQEVLNSIPAEFCAVPAESFSFEGDGEPSAKILGLVWTPKSDLFSYRISEAPAKVTKRMLMSEVGKLFDPVGFVAPVVFVGKCMIRELWQLGLGWDERPPEDLCARWERYRRELIELENFQLPRWVPVEGSQIIELHGFADSSTHGFAGVVYLRCIRPSQEISVSLIMAKSKIAKLKEHTIPRLELCAIELATRLLVHVKQILEPFGVPSITVWSDSTTALHWVTNPPHRWKTFVANRVSACQKRVPVECYRHIPTAMNPADCASRGVYPSEILNHPLWFCGPSWLRQPETSWPELCRLPTGQETDLIEARLVCAVNLVRDNCAENDPVPQLKQVTDIFARFSNLSKLCRVVGWMLRFCHNRILHRVKGLPVRTGRLSLGEQQEALGVLCRLAQQEAFSEDLQDLKRGRPAKKLLRNLNPFLDNKGILRVGGRLRHSALPYDQKFPVILPKSHRLTELIIVHYHNVYLHPGLSNLHSILRRHFWILAARSAITSKLSKCIACFRTNPTSIEPKMGDLPADRVNPGKPFLTSGVDYGGPFHIKMSRVRGAKILKGYICLFVCFTTKAVHLELASELSTEAFMAALKRFVSRRGAVSTIYSDCGTNFVGAKNKMEGWGEIAQSDEFNRAAETYCASRHIEWKLNPPNSPHFGGLWESGIKSTKRLLARVIGEQVLTFEEFYTVLVQVEATLNSRPLIPLSPDPGDLQALTPGHFLMMGPPMALPEPAAPPLNVTVRDRWTLLQQMVEGFWARWSKDYLNTLQRRCKWDKDCPNLEIGQMVILKDKNTPPLRWKLGRIEDIHPGQDGANRVVDVRTATGIYRRTAVNLCPLPTD